MRSCKNNKILIYLKIRNNTIKKEITPLKQHENTYYGVKFYAKKEFFFGQEQEEFISLKIN